MQSRKARCSLLVLAVVAASVLACGGGGTGETVGEGGATATAAPPHVAAHEVGDVVQVDGHTIVLNSAGFADEVLKANFTIENTGSEDLVVSSAVNFEAKDTEGTTLGRVMFACTPGLDGTVLPGDKLEGNICWGRRAPGVIRIVYGASQLGAGAVVWEIQ